MLESVQSGLLATTSYYNLHDKSFTSVAVANKPQGPYEFYGHVHYPDGKKFGTVKGDPYNFDPGVLVDGDKVFLYTGFAPNREFPAAFALFMKMSFGLCDDGYGVELESDMLTVKGNFVSTVPGWKNAEGTLFEGHGFYEASSPRKIGNTYYLIYSCIAPSYTSLVRSSNSTHRISSNASGCSSTTVLTVRTAISAACCTG